MPRNKRESLIYTVLMCFTMVLWMSIYNVTLHMGALNLTTIREAWIGFPIAYVFAMYMDWFVVSGPAKGFAFRFLVKPESPVLHKVIAVSCSMVVPMVIIMSLYGALEGCVKERKLRPSADHLAHEYSKEFCDGTAVPAHHRRTACPQGVPRGVSGRDCVSVKI